MALDLGAFAQANASQIASSGLNAAEYFLSQPNWGSDVTPDDVLALFAQVTSNNFTNIVGGLNPGQIGFLDNSPTFDVAAALNSFDPSSLMGLMGQWQSRGTGSIEFLTGLDGFSFGNLMGADPNQMMSLIGGLGADFQNAIYQDFGAEQFTWLDGAANFDLAGMMQNDFGFFSGIMAPEEALGLFGAVGGNLNSIVQGLGADDLAFLDSAEGFDLGGFLGTLPGDMLSGFMTGWGSENLEFLDELPSFDLAGTLGGFSPELMGTMLGGMDDPAAMSFLGGLDGFDFSGMLDQMPDSMVGQLVDGWDASMLGALGNLGGGFDPDAWISDAGATGFLPPDFDFGSLPDMPDGSGTPGSIPGGSTPPFTPPVGIPSMPSMPGGMPGMG